MCSAAGQFKSPSCNLHERKCDRPEEEGRYFDNTNSNCTKYSLCAARITDTRIRMLIEKSAIDRGLGLLQLEGDFDTKFVTWSVYPMFSQWQHHLHPLPEFDVTFDSNKSRN